MKMFEIHKGIKKEKISTEKKFFVEAFILWKKSQCIFVSEKKMCNEDKCLDVQHQFKHNQLYYRVEMVNIPCSYPGDPC